MNNIAKYVANSHPKPATTTSWTTIIFHKKQWTTIIYIYKCAKIYACKIKFDIILR